MGSREALLQCLNETAAQLTDFYQKLADPNVMIYKLWTAKDVLAHLTFWHESFARNVDDLVNGRRPVPLKGRYIDLNQSGVDAMHHETLETVVERFQSAQLVIQENILNPVLVLIPYKIGSREYTPEEHLGIVDAHITQHLRDVRKFSGRGKMNTTALIQKISVQGVDVDQFAQMAIHDQNMRDEIIHQMMTNPDIMVYYHCYYVVSKASQERPELFYQYWHEIASLLKHKNSYHRDFALTILANLTQVDDENLFSTIYPDYFEHINDDKFMTGHCCIINSLKIIRHKPELQNQIIALLLDVDRQCTYPEKQKALMKASILEILDALYVDVCDKEGVGAFIQQAAFSSSPKTRNKAKEMARKYLN